MGIVRKMRFALVMILVGAALAGAGVWYVGSHMLIRTESDSFWASRQEFDLKHWYVDVRDWGPMDFVKNREITSILIEHGYQEAMGSVQQEQKKLGETLSRALDDLSKKPE